MGVGFKTENSWFSEYNFVYASSFCFLMEHFDKTSQTFTKC